MRKTNAKRGPPIGTGIPIAVIYTRVSGDEQADEGTSLAVQLAECKRYVGISEWMPDRDCEYSDTMSGLRDDRADYRAMLARVRQLRGDGHIVNVVIADFDRLGRNTRERVTVWEELVDGLGVDIHSVRNGGVVPEIVHTVLAAVAKEEVKRTAMRVQKAWVMFYEKGWFRAGAAVAWGYRSRPRTMAEQLDGAPALVIEPDPIAVPYVQEVFRRAAAGEKTRTISRWCATLPPEVRGALPGKRNRNGEQIRDDRPRNMSAYMLRYVLLNPTYIGRMTRDGPLCKWEPIIDEAVFDRVQARLESNDVMPRRATGQHLLTGFLRCPKCNGRMQGTMFRKKSGTVFPRYRCGDGQRGGTRDNNCTASFPQRQVDAIVLGAVGALVDAILDPAQQRRAHRTWGKIAEPPDSGLPRDTEIRRLQRQKATAEKVKVAASRKYVQDQLPQKQFDALVAEEDATIARVDAELERLGVVVAPRPTLPPLADVMAVLGGWRVAVAEGDMIHQRDVLAAFVQRVVPRRIAVGRYDADIEWTPAGDALHALIGGTS